MTPEGYEFGESPISKAPKTILDFLKGSSKESPKESGWEKLTQDELIRLLTELGYYEGNKTGQPGRQSLTY